MNLSERFVCISRGEKSRACPGSKSHLCHPSIVCQCNLRNVSNRDFTYNPDTWRRASKTCIYFIITIPPECIRDRYILWM